jgi:hypothetical protein
VAHLAQSSKKRSPVPRKPFTGQVTVFNLDFKYRVEPAKTEILFPNQQLLGFPNWEIKGVRQQYYMDSYINIVIDEWCYSQPRPEEDHFGITASDVIRFLQDHAEKFSDSGMFEKLFAN